jgi:hypothetical protein
MYMGSLSYSKPRFVYSDATRQFSSDPKQECHIITLIDSDNPHCAARHKVAQAASKLPDDDSKKPALRQMVQSSKIDPQPNTSLTIEQPYQQFSHSHPQ